MIVAFNDSHGNPETSSVSAGTVQESPSETLSVVISGAPVEGVAITATVTDTDAVGGDLTGPVTYTWSADGSTVQSGTSASYTPTEADEGKVLTVAASFTDAAGNPEQGTGAASTAVAESPSETLHVVINGAPVEGVALTATVTDTDAVGGDLTGPVTYTWSADGSTVQSGTSASYTPTEADEGKALTVTASFTDVAGNPEHGTSAASAAVAESPIETLSVTINGTPVEGATITATVTDLNAVGGDLPASGITYQWYADGTLVHTALDNNSYTPTEADEGMALTVTASFTDVAGNPEHGTSAASAAVAESPIETLSVTINGTPVEGATITATVTDLNAVGGDLPASGITYQWYADGTLVHTAVDNNSYAPTEADEGKTLTVTASFTDAAGNPESGISAASSAVAESPAETLSVVITGAPVEGVAVTATVTDLNAVGGDLPASGVTYQWYADGTLVHTALDNNSYTPTEADEGKALTVTTSFTDATNDPESGTSAASAVVAESPTENATISLAGLNGDGNAVQDTPITATVTDGDAPASGIIYTFQTSSDGTNWTTVQTGTSASYTPTEADEHHHLQVKVSFTDTHGFAETGATSAGTVQESPTETTENASNGTPTVTITVLTQNGIDLQHQNVLAEMGAGTIQSGAGATGFTVVDSADHVEFVVDGNNFTYDGNTVTGGTLTSFHEFTTDSTPVALADFTGISVSAATWMSDVKQAAAGDDSAIKALTATFAYNFIGGPGNDSFGSAGHADTLSGSGKDFFDGGGAPAGSHDTLTGGAGSTFVFAAGYGALTITNFDQANGVFDHSEGDEIELNGFAGPPTVTYVNGNAIADFGNGDVLTLPGVNPANLANSDFINNNGGNGNNSGGPQISNAGNIVTYTGTPIFLDQSIAVSDTAGTVTSVNAWFSSGAQTGDELTIDGKTDGDLTNSDGTIHYHFDGNSISLTETSGSPTLTDFNADLQLIQFTPGAADGARTVTWAAHEAVNTSPTVTTTINVGPVLNSFTLTVSNGGTTVLSNSDFNVSDPGFTSFTYSVNNVTHGEFEVFNGQNWVSAPTGGFTSAQIAAGDVRFVQSGGDVAPTFSIQVSDGPNVSPAIAPTVIFDAPVIVTQNPALVAQNSFGGAGEHQGAAVTYADGHLYLSYNNGPENQSASDNADIVAFNTAPDGASQTFTYGWSKGDFLGIAADGSKIYAAGESFPGDGLTTDNFGGAETKSIFVQFDTGGSGTTGNTYSPALGDTAHTFYSYGGVESFQNIIATTQGGNTVLYALGFGQPASYSGYIVGEYNSSGTLLATATDPGSLPGGSSANGAVDWQGALLWAVGSSQHGSEAHGSPTVWTFSHDLGSVSIHEDNIGVAGVFNGVATIGSELYAVGTAYVTGGQDYVIAEYNTDGSVSWSQTFGAANADSILNGAVTLNGHLYVVGSTTSGGITEGVLMEINPSNGGVISTTTYDPAQYNSFTSITTDGHYLYIAGVSGSGTSQDQAVLLTYDPGVATTTVEDTAVKISSLAVSDVVAGSAQIEVTLAAGHGSVTLENSSGLDSVVGAGTGSVELFGSQAAINAALAQGVVYDPVLNYTGTDTLTITANDQGHNGSGVAESATQGVAIAVTPAVSIADGASCTVSGPSGDTIDFVSGNGTLHLTQPSTFTGEIAGISGSGDVLDLHGFAAGTTTAVTGSGSYNSIFNTTTLTVTDLSDHQTETFTLAGDLSGSTWTVTTDNNGGVNIVDPPASGGQPAGGMVMHDPGPAASQTIVASAPNQTLTGSGASDNFVFNFAGVGHDTVTDFHPATDTLQFASPIFADAQAAFHATQDDGHGNTVVIIDGQDSITLAGVLKAQLHATDFHVV